MNKFIKRKDCNTPYPLHERQGRVLGARNLKYWLKSPRYFTPAGLEHMEFKPPRSLSSAIQTMILHGPEALMERFTVADPPINDKTGQPFGMDTKKVADWARDNGIDLAKLITLPDSARMHQAVESYNSNGTIKNAKFSSDADGFYECNDLFFPVQRHTADGLPVYLRTVDNMDDVEYAARAGLWLEILAFQRYTSGRLSLESMEGNHVTVGYLIVVEENFPFRVRTRNVVINKENVENLYSVHNAWMKCKATNFEGADAIERTRALCDETVCQATFPDMEEFK